MFITVGTPSSRRTGPTCRIAGCIAGALLALGTRHALVVHGEPGLDELSPLGPTHVIEVRGGEAREWTLDPRELGFHDIAEADLVGGSPGDNAQIIDAVLTGRGPRGARAAVVLNAAAALYVGGGAPSIAQAVSVATAALESGEGAAALDRLRSAYGQQSTSGDRIGRATSGPG